MNDKKRPKSYSMDGFTPMSSNPGRVGFDGNRSKIARKQQQRIDSFPSVGMTFSSYAPLKPGQHSTVGFGGKSKPVSDFNLADHERLAPLPPEEPIKKQPKLKKKRRFHLNKKRIAAIIIILILIPFGWLGFKFAHNASKIFRGNPLSILTTTKLQGEDTGRVNILLAGNSSDDVGHQGGDLTDSIMILSIDTKDNSAVMLSVPRDLWVNIPDYGHAKINEAYVDGEAENYNVSGYFPGGMGLLQQVIQDNLGISLNYYALVNYNAFRDMVNAVGGIDFNVKSTDKRGLYDPSVDYVTHGPLVKLTNGVHTLNGEQALDLARARGDAYGSYGFPGSDFDRTTHQRQEILALRAKATSTGVLANPLKISSLLDAVGQNVKTDFSLGEVRRLVDITKSITATSIQSVSLNNVNSKNYLANYTSDAGESALTPAAGLDDFSDIQSLITRLTSNNAVTREGATVAVLNATDTSGLATKTMTTLTGKGLISGGVDDAPANQATTSIIDLSGGTMPATKKLLVSLYGNNVVTTDPYNGAYSADFIVVVGADQVPKTPTTTTPTTTGQ